MLCGICITCIISRNIHIALWHMHHMNQSYLATYILRCGICIISRNIHIALQQFDAPQRSRDWSLCYCGFVFSTVITLNASRISTANTYRSIGNIRCVLLHTPIRHSIFPWYHKFHLRSFHIYEQATNILLINVCETGVYIPVALNYLTFHEEVSNALAMK